MSTKEKKYRDVRKPTRIYLDESERKKAVEIGNGILGHGIRKTIQRARPIILDPFEIRHLWMMLGRIADALEIEQSIRATEPTIYNAKSIENCLAVIPTLIRRCRKSIVDETGKPRKQSKKATEPLVVTIPRVEERIT